MNKKFIDLCAFVEQATLNQISPTQAYFKLSSLSTDCKTRIKEIMWEFLKNIDTREYVFGQALVILATYAAAVADDFDTDANIVLLAMLTDQNE